MGGSRRGLATAGLALVLAASLFGCASADDQSSSDPQTAATASAAPEDESATDGGGSTDEGSPEQDPAGGSGEKDSGNGADKDAGGEVDPADAFRAAGSAEPGEPAVVEGSGTGEEKRKTVETVALDEPASPAEGLEITVVSMEPVQAEGMGPGGMSGPALAVVVTVHNTTDAPVETLGGAVTATYGPDDLPAELSLQTDDRSLPLVVAAGGTVSGTYTFLVPEDQREDLVITASYRASDPAVVFTGGADR